jgi:hypothetical protein
MSLSHWLSLALLASLAACSATPATPDTRPPAAPLPSATFAVTPLPTATPGALPGRLAFALQDRPGVTALDLATRQARTLFSAPQGAEVPALARSPDAHTIYFTYLAIYYNPDGSLNGSALELRAVDVAGGAVRTVLAGGVEPAVSPDGRRLAYAFTDQQTVFSPDGQWIAMLGARGVYVMDAGGEHIARVFEQGGHGSITWGK